MATESSRSVSISPKPSLSNQPTPFSIEDILSRSKSHLEQPEIRRSMSLEFQENSTLSGHHHNHHENIQIYDKSPCGSIEHDPRLSNRGLYQREQSSPDCRASVVRELDILRRNLAQANLTNFGTLPRTNFDSLESLAGITSYRKIKETNCRQQDEALDMSKNKYLGKY